MAQLFTDNQYNLFKYIARLTEQQLKAVVKTTLETYGYEPKEYSKSIVAEGKIPIALVAHLDTVFKRKPCKFIYDRQQNIMSDPYGLGADDRLGVMGIFQILGSGLRPHIIFTCEEETGAAGADEVAKLDPFEDIRFLIELDRQGSNDCVFYNCENRDFIDYIEEFGFHEEFGTFTDISVICPAWGVAGVNLSTGYFNEHTLGEYIQVDDYFNTLSKVTKILSVPEDEIPFFEYVPWHFDYELNGNVYSSNSTCKCHECGDRVSYAEFLPTVYEDGSHPICYTCLNDNSIDWCDSCCRPFKVSRATEALSPLHICYSCIKGGRTP